MAAQVRIVLMAAHSPAADFGTYYRCLLKVLEEESCLALLSAKEKALGSPGSGEEGSLDSAADAEAEGSQTPAVAESRTPQPTMSNRIASRVLDWQDPMPPRLREAFKAALDAAGCPVETTGLLDEDIYGMSWTRQQLAILRRTAREQADAYFGSRDSAMQTPPPHHPPPQLPHAGAGDSSSSRPAKRPALDMQAGDLIWQAEPAPAAAAAANPLAAATASMTAIAQERGLIGAGQELSMEALLVMGVVRK